MSAIAGYLRTARHVTSTELISGMLQTMGNRGPDGVGAVLIDSSSRRSLDLSFADTPSNVPGCTPASEVSEFHHDLALGHRRFSLQDLTAAAHQPFWSRSHDICAVLDGEIYNGAELSADLKSAGHEFRSRSDVEILIEAYRKWGAGCFSRLAGFWALALYDARRGAVLLARDRVGQASLYFTRSGGGLLWASDINAVRHAEGSGAFPINDHAVSDFLSFGYRDLYDRTFYRGIDTFPQASFAWIEPDGRFTPEVFWKIPRSRLRESDISVEQAAGQVRSVLGQAVNCRLTADVPVAFELSGGMDSSSLVASAAACGSTRMSAYTIKFPGAEEDEVVYANMVEQRYRDSLDLQIIEQPIDDFFEAADEYVGAMAEPFHSPNMLTNQRIWKAMAAQGIRASINGAAGDELFYSELVPHMAWLMKHGSLFRLHREAMASTEMQAGAFDGMYRWRMKRAAKLVAQQLFCPIALHQRQTRTSQRMASYGLQLPLAPCPRPFLDSNQGMIDDMTGWQMNYWMRSSSQSSSTVPMQIRMPFLDHRLIDLAFRLPMGYLLRDGWIKWILRVAMQDLLPPEIVWRKKKMGFPFPYQSWLSASRPTVQALLTGLDCPYINPGRLMDSYETIARQDHKLLWRVISLALWWKKCVLGRTLQHYARQAVAV